MRLGAPWSWNARCGLERGGYLFGTLMGELTSTRRFFCCLCQFRYTGRGGRFTTEKDLSNVWRAGGAPEGYATRLKRVKGEEYGSSILHLCMLYGIPRKPVASYCFAVIWCADTPRGSWTVRTPLKVGLGAKLRWINYLVLSVFGVEFQTFMRE